MEKLLRKYYAIYAYDSGKRERERVREREREKHLPSVEKILRK